MFTNFNSIENRNDGLKRRSAFLARAVILNVQNSRFEAHENCNIIRGLVFRRVKGKLKQTEKKAKYFCFRLTCLVVCFSCYENLAVGGN